MINVSCGSYAAGVDSEVDGAGSDVAGGVEQGFSAGVFPDAGPEASEHVKTEIAQSPPQN